MPPFARRLFSTAAVLAAIGAGGWSCGGDEKPGAGIGATGESGTPVTTTLSPSQQQESAALQAQLDEVKDLDAAGFAAKYAVPFVTDLGYDPLLATGLDRVQRPHLR